MKKKVIIFDMDGVIFDSIAFAAESLRYSYPTMTDESHRELLSGSFYEELQKLKLKHKPREQTPEEREFHKAEYARKKAELPAYPGMEALIKKLHQAGFILALNTSARERNCLPLLQKIGIDACIDFIGTKEISPSKVEKFNLISEKYAVPKSDMLFVTDTLGDVREAKEAGVPTIGVTWGGHTREYLMSDPNEYLVAVVDSVGELGDFLLG